LRVGSRWGVFAAGADDASFRARLQAWMDRLFEEWLDLPVPRGVAKLGIAFGLGPKDRRFKSGRPD
jgi:hypothetical protein